jgi:hypothetical protein
VLTSTRVGAGNRETTHLAIPPDPASRRLVRFVGMKPVNRMLHFGLSCFAISPIAGLDVLSGFQFLIVRKEVLNSF